MHREKTRAKKNAVRLLRKFCKNAINNFVLQQ